MYDTEEEIRRKRRNLLIVIGIVVFLILLLIIFLLTRGSGKKKPQEVGEMSCELEVKDDIEPDATGTYHQSIEIGFKKITAVSESYEITKQTVGLADRSTNKSTFTVTKSGNYHLYGYVQDNAGHKGKCEIELVVSLSKPAGVKYMSEKNVAVDVKLESETSKEISGILKCLKVKIIFFIILEFLFTLFFFYYVTAFCQVYKSTQISWLLDSISSYVISFGITLVFSFIFAILYKLSIIYKKKIVFSICQFMY